MYSKEEASTLRQQFWIAFGKYMKPIPSAEGLAINWINYKTGVKHLFFKMDVSQKEASIAIIINHPYLEQRQQVFEQFKAFKILFVDAVGEEWDWEEDEARISVSLKPVSIFNKDQWPLLISFLKPRIIALDQFWVDVKPVFEAL